MESLRPSDPSQIGAYRLIGRLGAGGMGEVFLGESPGHRKVAVKLVKPEHADDQHFRQRFAREVEAAKMVGGFHTAPVVDADPDGDPPWLVTAFIPGPSLATAVRESGPLAPEAVQRLGAALAEGLAAIHACGVIHRDLKPANVILADDGPRIIDFGIARAMETTTDLTSTGTLIGTIAYMSPEQIGGERVDARSDIFSLGSVLAFAGGGHSPFEADTMALTAARITGGPPSLGEIADPLRGIIADCLAKNPAERPALEALTAAFTGNAPVQPPHTPPPSPERITADPTAPAASSAAPDSGTHTRTAAPRHPGMLEPSHPDTLQPSQPDTSQPSQPDTPQPSQPGTPQTPAYALPPRKSGKGVAIGVSVAAVAVAAVIGVGSYALLSTGTSETAGGTAKPSATAKPPAHSLISSRFTGHWHGRLSNTNPARDSRYSSSSITSASAVGDTAGTSLATDIPDRTLRGKNCTLLSHLVSASATEVTLHETVTSGSCHTEYFVLTEASPGLNIRVYKYNPGRPIPPGANPRGPIYTGHLTRTKQFGSGPS